MLQTLYICVKNEHDIRLVALAGFICIFGCFTAVNLFAHAREASGGRRHMALLSSAAAVFAAGVWATHFVAELAFKPGLPVAYDFDLTAVSMVIAVLVTSIGMIVVLQAKQPELGGFVVGAAIAAMHYTGMAALRVPADLDWRASYVVLSLVIAGVISAAAFSVLCRGCGWASRMWATVLLVVAICGLHFVGMAAIVLVPDPSIVIPKEVVAPDMLAVLVAAVSIGIGIIGMSLSIFEEQSARRATREAEQLRLSREHLARAQRISNVGSIVRDLRTGRNECSEEFNRIFGIGPGEFDPTIDNVMKFVHPADQEKARAAQRVSAAAGLAAAGLEYRIVRPNGDVRVVYREMEVATDDAGRPVRRTITFKDITELRGAQEREKELQRQLMHSQKLEALGTLAGGVAHELNNALVPVVALAKIMRDDLPEDSPLREDAELIIDASERARELVKQILNYSRKQGDLGREPVDVATAAEDALRMLRASLPTTIHIKTEIDDVVPPVLGDAGELRQAIVNLVTNAAQAIGSAVGTITVTVDRSEGNIRLRVADTGRGMDSAIAERIFEPFFTTKAVGEGTGLGLSIVHWIVSNHGGRIDVQSRPGEGTVFTVSLPAASRFPAAVGDDPAAGPAAEPALRQSSAA